MRACRLLSIAAVLIVLCACSRAPEEERLRDQMNAMQQALEDGRPADFLEGVSEDFTGQDGYLDQQKLGLYLRGLRLRNQSIGITVLSTDVTMQGDRATVVTTALATAGSGSLLPEQAEAWRVTSGWRLEGGDWVVYNARWEPAL